jgi:hypothetical protein
MLSDKLWGWHKSAETCNLYTEAIAIVQTVTHSTEAPGACVRIIHGKKREFRHIV